ncbi:unnamed protein product [Boreogadus saida]
MNSINTSGCVNMAAVLSGHKTECRGAPVQLVSCFEQIVASPRCNRELNEECQCMDLLPFWYIIPFQGLHRLLRVREDLWRSAVSGVNIEPGRVSQCAFHSLVAQGLLHFSEGTALSHDVGVIREDKDLASLVPHGLSSAK